MRLRPDATVDCDPIIVSGSMDQEVRFWSFSSGHCLMVQDSADSHITCVSCLNIEDGDDTKHAGPVVCAGDGYGIIWVWSLTAPYALLYSLRSHTDEVRTLFAFDAEGLHPILVSGSLDCTVKVWDLDLMSLVKTIEGHTADLTEVRVFNLGGADLVLVSASLDTTVRVTFDFMEAAPQHDTVAQLFEFNLNGINAHVVVNEYSSFPRIHELSHKEGASQFFGTYHSLFADALGRGRSDFLQEFLPLSLPGLLRSNRNDQKRTSLLHMALELDDLLALRVIVDCWCSFYTTAPPELIHDEVEGRLSMQDMLMLASAAPAEFERLICSIQMVPVIDNIIPAGSYFLYERDSDKAMRMSWTSVHGDVPKRRAEKTLPFGVVAKVAVASTSKAASVAESIAHQTDDAACRRKFMYLPLTNAVHMDMLSAYTNTCLQLDSVEIFNSDVGRLALAYAWRRMGLRVHVRKMLFYLVFVVLSTASLLTFTQNKGDPSTGWLSYVMIGTQLLLNVYFAKEEWLQLGVDPVGYLSDIWNAMDFVVILTYDKDTVSTRALLSIASIVGYFNILYYLRAFEDTGPLVSMILKISRDIVYLLVVVMIVLVGFGQAFWILCEEQADSAFRTIEASLINLYSFMLGNYDPEAFDGIYHERLAITLSALFMMIVSILLLNLLIALMGDSYGSVKEKGLAQWKLEQAQIITEMQRSMSEQDRTCTSKVYFRTYQAVASTVSDREAEAEAATVRLAEAVADLKQSQAAMMEMLQEQQENMRQQAELNCALQELLLQRK